jgi:hypothetical protein
MSTTFAGKDAAVDSIHLADKLTTTIDDTESTSSAGYDGKATRRLLRKIDLTLIPFLALLYL